MANPMAGSAAKGKGDTSRPKTTKTQAKAKEKVMKPGKGFPDPYTAKLDTKKRITIRGAKYQYYAVIPQPDDTFLLKPQVLLGLEDISPDTLAMMDEAMKNFKAGRAYGPIDLT